MNIFIVILILASGLLGAWYHFLSVKKVYDVKSFFEYFFINNTAGSKSAFFAFAAAMQAAYTTGVFNNIDIDKLIESTKAFQIYPQLIGAIVAAATIGFVCDNKFNTYVSPEIVPDPIVPIEAAPIVAPTIPIEATADEGSVNETQVVAIPSFAPAPASITPSWVKPS